MRLPRIRAVDLRYGCHEGRFELPDEPRPVVICGRNGSGKTTLLEAPLRTLYGFVRRRPEERRLLDLRQPWSGRPAEGEIDLLSATGRAITIRRDFSSDEVVVIDASDGTELFRGDGNPVGVRSESRRYQQLLREWIGFAELEPYRKTAWVGQGELIGTRLDDELLRAAAGTHRRVEGALEELKEAYDRLTQASIDPAGRRKNRARELEDLREERARLEERIERARRARERRRPLRREAREVAEAVQRLDAEIDLLEAAFRPLSERRTLLAEQRQIADRLGTLSDAGRRLRDAHAAEAAAASELAAVSGGGEYPDDIESRLGQAVVLWERRAALIREAASPGPAAVAPSVSRPALPATGLRVAGVAAVLLGMAIGFAVAWLPGLLIALLGASLALASLRSRGARGRPESEATSDARRPDRELAHVEERLAALGEGLPAPPLTADTLQVHRDRHRSLVTARDRDRRARERLRDALERAHQLLGPEAGREASDAAAASSRLEEAESEARTALARVQLRLEDQPAAPDLPPGVEATVGAVDAARGARRAERAALAERRSELELELRDMERASEDVFVLDRELARVRERIAATEEEVAVRRLAWELVSDAYEEFRGQDQSRLLAAVNTRLAALSGQRLGPITVETDLLSARVDLAGRSVPLESPPLSFGERHLVLLAIRLGAADFLSGEDLRHPVLVDEPFTHLDEVRAAEVWDLLTELASERQVVVTTQNRLVLAHLGVSPDFELALPEAGGAGEASRATRREPAGEATTSESSGERADGRPEPPGGPEPSDNAPPRRPIPEQAQLDLG